jgi:thiol-disulfide isomerase/thioredoxin
MRKHLSTYLIIIVAICVAIFYYQRYRVPPVIDLPGIDLIDLNGHKININSLSGHPLFISFFATWCGPCIHELPQLADLADKLTDLGLQVICISDEPIVKLQILSARFSGRILFLHSTTDMHSYGIYTYPTNYIFNNKGTRVYQKTEPEEWQDSAVIARVRLLLQH